MMTGTHSCVVICTCIVTVKCMYVPIINAVYINYCRIAVETLWNVLPEMKVEPDEELTERVSGYHITTSPHPQPYMENASYMYSKPA